MASKASVEDRKTLEQYLQSVRDVEKEIGQFRDNRDQRRQQRRAHGSDIARHHQQRQLGAVARQLRVRARTMVPAWHDPVEERREVRHGRRLLGAAPRERVGVLAQQVEAEALGGDNVGGEGLVSGRRVQPVGPVALV